MPREKIRIGPLAWIGIAVLVLLLWIYFHFLSLGLDTTTPAIHWSAPTGTQ